MNKLLPLLFLFSLTRQSQAPGIFASYHAKENALSAAPTGVVHDQPTLPKLYRIERSSRSFRYIKEAD